MTYKDYGPFLGTMLNRLVWHSFDGKPAIIYKNCEDNPRSGSKWWYTDGEQHREDGPAVIHPDGYQAWCLNNKLHREDGPAIIYSDGSKYWYINGKHITKEVNDWAKERNIDLNNMSDEDKFILQTELKIMEKNA
jgi:hypothetical protein